MGWSVNHERSGKGYKYGDKWWITVNKASLIHLEYFDLTDSSNCIAKLQHKLQQTVHIEDMKLENGCDGTRSYRMRHPI